MYNSALRQEVLRCFKSLHRARQLVFDGDYKALTECRIRINEEFKKNKQVQEVSMISELIQFSKAVENELKTTVIQAKEVAPGKYEARIRPETVKLDNVPFKNMPV
ncbi:hypothetical protein ILUMI_20661 [Ignelater luminosus]|uniref:Complex III assembly factor LYRM7 n=1 Tax=Ignelater luminosus TaxID=2038154 RepID=A0A8K0G4C8_IGNLU|nr:hypothetical protein ILUMI_20661 [Ignelater luminosus]